MRNSPLIDIPPDAVLSVLGTSGSRSFSMQCAEQLIQPKLPDLRIQPRASAAELMLDAEQGGYCLLPITNYSSGDVVPHMNWLLRSAKSANVRIVGNAILEVRMAAIGTLHCALDTVRVVQSHPQGIEQCQDFLATLPPHETKPTRSTDEAVRLINGDDHTIALASPEAIPEGSGLHVLQHRVSNSEMQGELNATEFPILHGGKGGPLDAGKDIHLCAMTPENRPGVLTETLDIIRRYGGDLYKVDSRPIGVRKYTFIIGFQPGPNGADYETMFAELQTIKSPDSRPLIQSLGSWNQTFIDPRLQYLPK